MPEARIGERSPDDDGPSVVVVMLTYLRTAGLVENVDAVLASMREVEEVQVSLLVVDNDPEASAMALAHRWHDHDVRFVHEPRPGIAAARNRALDEVEDGDLLVFIDDDERPEPGWLRSLVTTWEETEPAAVVGAVVSVFPREPEAWIREGGFFQRRRLETGTEVAMAATNNLLLDVDQVRSAGLRFDSGFSVIGGSDSVFTSQIRRAGGRIVWCDEAVVLDVVPESRLNREWVLRRAFRLGNSTSRVGLALEDGLAGRTARRLQLTGRGLIRVFGGGGRIVFGVVMRSVGHRARGARTLARGLGMTGGAWGYGYEEYRRDEPE